VGLIWIGLVILILTLRPVIVSDMHGVTRIVLSIGLTTLLWLVTPYVLLGRRVPWRCLPPPCWPGSP
jgi:membrane protein